jgi:hypothetical protein
VQARRLPILESIVFQGSGQRNAKWHILGVNTVVEALAAVSTGHTWQQALLAAVPQRKRTLQEARCHPVPHAST